MTASTAKLTNESQVQITIGPMSFLPGEEIVYWDVYSSDSAEDTFNNLRLVESTMHSLIADGYISMYEDSVEILSEASEGAFELIKINYDQKNNVVAMLNTGVKLQENKDSRGNMLFVEEKRVGSDLEIVTHNYADKTTWYTNSVRVFGEIPTDTGDGVKFKLANEFVVDLVNGKIHNEEKIIKKSIDDGSYGYIPVVTVDGYQVLEHTLFEADDNNCLFSVDYRDGYINFFEDMSGKTITVDYSYATNSDWVLRPNPGKRIDIEKSEVQFSQDMIYNDAIDFEIWAYNPYDLPNKVMVEKTSYKSMHNFIDEAAGSYPLIPVCGGPAPMGKTSPTLGFPFNYNTIRSMSSAEGVELIIKTRNGREFGGERSTATFYCTIHDI